MRTPLRPGHVAGRHAASRGGALTTAVPLAAQRRAARGAVDAVDAAAAVDAVAVVVAAIAVDGGGVAAGVAAVAATDRTTNISQCVPCVHAPPRLAPARRFRARLAAEHGALRRWRMCFSS